MMPPGYDENPSITTCTKEWSGCPMTNDLKCSESDQAQAKEAAKKRVVDLGFKWNESAPAKAKP